MVGGPPDTRDMAMPMTIYNLPAIHFCSVVTFMQVKTEGGDGHIKNLFGIVFSSQRRGGPVLQHCSSCICHGDVPLCQLRTLFWIGGAT